MAGPLVSVELDDVQGLAFYGYLEQPFARYLLVRFESDAPRARGWLAKILPEVRHARAAQEGRPAETLQVAFTAQGLLALGLDEARELSLFPHEFGAGMHSAERARILGDVGDGAPERWEFGGPSSPLHALLMLFADTEEKVLLARARHEELLEAAGARVVHQDAGHIFPDQCEHFGFRDGISQPHVEGGPRTKKPSPELSVPPGELLLGYTNAYDDPTPTMTIRGVDVGKNGTFLVYRTIRQDVVGFWSAIYERARPARGEDADAAAARLAAKTVGRWRSGAPLVLHPEHDAASARTENHFGFAENDPAGLRCPLGAHIRRAHPRDSLPPSPAESLETSRRHRLVRRGRPYGPRAMWPVFGKKDDGVDRGLVFIALNASIRRQFEFIQQTWLNSRKFARLYEESDPILGQAGGAFTLQGSPVRRRLEGLPSFTRLRGGGYFFLPGIRALRFFAQSP